MVKGIDEVASELQPEALGELKILMQTNVYISVVRRPQVSKLIWARAERPYARIGEVAVVSEPLEATDSVADRRFSRDFRNRVAIGADAAREGAGIISRSARRYRQRKAGAEADDRANLPASNNGIHELVCVFGQEFATADR